MLSRLPTHSQTRNLVERPGGIVLGAHCRTLDTVAAGKALAPGKIKAIYGKDRGHKLKEARPDRCGLESRGGQLCINKLLG